ncbi:serum paraoxonase/arylesterase 1-like isoform X6 [Mytilus galloprovincialis]|uniref:serum paraoxonase/arylesterase 1-like isoform X2 n=1 Tax=Mytilus galloprovincialis TaxID=29158 RepID=UPI003F7B4122
MIKKAITAVIGLLIIQFIVKFLLKLELFKHVYNHTPGPCRIVPGEGIGYEDMETLPNGITIITSGLVMPGASSTVSEHRKKHNGKGRIYLFDFNQPDKGIEELKIVGDQFNHSDFGPHGISLWKDKDKVTVMVVNHGSAVDTIEKFLFIAKDKQLKHLHTYRDPTIHMVNDVAMDSENSFYFTNYAYYKSGLFHVLEAVIPLAYGNLMYYDGKAYHKQDEGLFTLNGLVLSHDQKYLYTGETIPQKFHTFTRQKNGTLSRYQEFNVKTAIDNPTLDKDGNVLFGTHPIIWQVMGHTDNPETPAPSQVIKLHMKDGAVTKMTEVFADDGHTLYGSSVASLYNDAMLVGTVLHKLMYCEVRWID